MFEVEDDEGVGVGFCAGETHARPACAGGYVGRVDTHIYRAVGGADEAAALGRALVDIVHEAVGRVRTLYTYVISAGNSKLHELSIP